MAGIDTAIFTAHSTRTASTSCAKAKGLPSHVIMEAAGWHSESTFAKFYNKCIIKENFGGKLSNNNSFHHIVHSGVVAMLVGPLKLLLEVLSIVTSTKVYLYQTFRLMATALKSRVTPSRRHQ